MEPSVPSDSIDTSLPLYQALGLTRKQSDDVYFAVTENIMPCHKTTALILKAIATQPTWTPEMKVYAAYNLKFEILVRAGVPRVLLDQIDIDKRGS